MVPSVKLAIVFVALLALLLMIVGGIRRALTVATRLLQFLPRLLRSRPLALLTLSSLGDSFLTTAYLRDIRPGEELCYAANCVMLLHHRSARLEFGGLEHGMPLRHHDVPRDSR